MTEVLEVRYIGIKIFHVISVVAWYAGLFYFYRLFVYHVQHQDDAKLRRVFESMERRLLRAIMAPACLATLASGLALSLALPGTWSSRWFWVKLVAVATLLAYQELGRRLRLRFAKGDFAVSEKTCRLLNEVPTLALIVIVTMVIAKPWIT